MLAASDQRVEDPQLRIVNAGKAYPKPNGTIDSMRWLGAGWPDYPWLFGTDGEYTAYAAVAAGQFAPIKAHLRALRDVSEVVNGGSGKIVHEVTPDGAVYFGANADAGNTDESSKYPSAVALVWRWTGDNALPARPLPGHRPRDEARRVPRRGRRRLARGARQRRARGHGRGEARQRRLHDPRLRRPRRHGAGPRRPGHRDVGDQPGRRDGRRSSRTPGGTTRTARSPTPTRSTTRATRRSSSGTGSGSPRPTPCCRALGSRQPGPARVPRAREHHARPARAALLHRRARALPHRHRPDHRPRRATPAPAATPCVSKVPSERSIFTLNSAIAAVSEGNYGRLGSGQQGTYTLRQRPQPARPDAVGDARRDARDRPRRRLRRQHRPASSPSARW